MKMMKLAVLIAMIALTLFLVLPNLSWAAADDGAVIYKAKCAACHGADLGGKPAAKIPSLVSDDAKKSSDADLTDMIANGGKDKKAMHAFANKGVSADQVKMVIGYIRESQKK
jgi:cytochrome c6